MLATTPLSDLITVGRLREQELEEARVIQGAMLPAQPLHTSNVIISHEFQPVTEVGGDYLDCFTLSDDNVGLYIGDVSGKGLPAALYAALAVGALRGVHKTGQCPSRVLSLLNSRLHLRGIPGRHTAVQYGIFYPQTGEMRIVSAGMPGPLLLRGEKWPLETGLAGNRQSAGLDEFSLQLQLGDSVFFCTDGLTDTRNSEEEFGVERIQQVCLQHSGSPPWTFWDMCFLRSQNSRRTAGSGTT
jgi:sigma-B regulation protein RsbU (phosphoserine phosphatase)